MLSWSGRCARGACVKKGLVHILVRMGPKVEVVDGDEEVLGSILGADIDI